MMENSKISWTDHTFNPWIGCQKVGIDCKNCYAERQMTRKERWSNTWGPAVLTQRLKTSDSYWRKPLTWNRKAKELNVRKRVFCGSLMDIFEDNKQVSEWRSMLFEIIDATPNLDWLLLTKRPENIKRLWPWGFYDHQFTWQNVWMGTSVCNQETADQRIPHLLDIPAKVRFLSCEPLLGYINLARKESYWIEMIDWIIVGGESGPISRPLRLEWMEFLINQCVDTPVFVKQDSGRSPGLKGAIPDDWWNLKGFPNE